MDIDWVIIGIVGTGLILLVILLVRQNLKDKKDVTKHFNDLYKTDIEEESEQDDDMK